MTFRIYFIKNGVTDYVTIEGESIEEIRKEADEVIGRIKPEDYWSEQYL